MDISTGLRPTPATTGQGDTVYKDNGRSREVADNLIIHTITGGSTSIIWRALNRYCTACVHANTEYTFSKTGAVVSLP